MAPNLILLVSARYNLTFITDETRAARNSEPAHKYQSWKRSCGQGFVNFYGGMYKKVIFISMQPTKTAELLPPRGKHLAPKKGGD